MEVPARLAAQQELMVQLPGDHLRCEGAVYKIYHKLIDAIFTQVPDEPLIQLDNSLRQDFWRQKTRSGIL